MNEKNFQELQEENKRLNKGIEALVFMSNKTKQERDELQERIDKAIEYLNNYKKLVGLTGLLIMNLNRILKGENKK